MAFFFQVENMMLTEEGHVKLIDFGTAKDLMETDLNGPEFVGTPEYMSPQTLASKPVGVEADLWYCTVTLSHTIIYLSLTNGSSH